MPIADTASLLTSPPAARLPARRLALLAIAAISVTACSADLSNAPRGERGARRRTTDVTPSATEQLLYQQAPVTGTSLYTPTGYEAVADFTVPSGGRWKVTRVVLVGGAYDQSFYFNVYPDAGGQPSTHVVISAGGGFPAGTADPCCGGDVFDYSYPIGFIVEPGTYWISMRSPFHPQVAAQQGYPALVGTWYPSNWVATGLSAPNNDFAFSIYGTVETPSSATVDLMTTLDGFGLDFGTQNSFEVKLQAALDAIDAGDTASACQYLQDLINAVKAQSGKKLTVAQADAIIAEATRIRGLIGC